MQKPIHLSQNLIHVGERRHFLVGVHALATSFGVYIGTYKCAQFLDLPLAIGHEYPLSFSLAYEVLGQKMLSR